MNRRYIFDLELEINSVVYLRRDGKVIGAKYLGLESTALGCMSVTKHIFHRADGVKESLKVSGGFFREKSKEVFLTIEDAIHETNPIEYQLVELKPMMELIFGFTTEPSSTGCYILGKDKWLWDGYSPKRIHVCHSEFKFIWDGEWECEYVGKKDYYNSEESCRQDNHVDVITF